MVQKTGKQKIEYIEVLRCLCAFAVVGIHITMTQPNNYSIGEIGKSNYLILTSVYALVQWAVPVFLMISGSLLLNADEITLSKIKKYVWRILLVIMLFGTAYAVMELFFETKQLTLTTLPKAILMAMEGRSWSHLWYLYVLIGIYLILIPLKRFVDHAKPEEINSLFACLIIGNFVIPEINSTMGTSLQNFMVLTQYVTFFLLGYILIGRKNLRGGGMCINLDCGFDCKNTLAGYIGN